MREVDLNYILAAHSKRMEERPAATGELDPLSYALLLMYTHGWVAAAICLTEGTAYGFDIHGPVLDLFNWEKEHREKNCNTLVIPEGWTKNV